MLGLLLVGFLRPVSLRAEDGAERMSSADFLNTRATAYLFFFAEYPVACHGDEGERRTAAKLKRESILSEAELGIRLRSNFAFDSTIPCSLLQGSSLDELKKYRQELPRLNPLIDGATRTGMDSGSETATILPGEDGSGDGEEGGAGTGGDNPPPGHGGTPPGHGGTPPGHGGAPPGHSGTPPGKARGNQ